MTTFVERRATQSAFRTETGTMEMHSDATDSLPWYRDATTGGKAVLLGSAVLCGALPLLGAWLEIGVAATLTLAVLQLVAANVWVALSMQKDQYDFEMRDDQEALDADPGELDEPDPSGRW